MSIYYTTETECPNCLDLDFIPFFADRVHMLEMEIEFDVDPGEKQTRDHPGHDASLKAIDITADRCPVCGYNLEDHKDDWWDWAQQKDQEAMDEAANDYDGPDMEPDPFDICPGPKY